MGLSDTFTAAVTGQFYLHHRLHIDKNRLGDTHTITSTQILREDLARPTHQQRAAIFYWLHLFFPWNVVSFEFEIVAHLHPPCQDPGLSLNSAGSFSNFTATAFSIDQLRLISPFQWWCELPVIPLVVSCNIVSKCLYHVYQNICLKMVNNICFPRFDFNS